MDSRRFLLAVLLMIAVMIVTNIILPPPERPLPLTGADSAGVVVDSAGGAGPLTDSGVADSLRAVGQPDTPGIAVAASADSTSPAAAGPDAAAVPADTVVAISPLFAYGISTHGGSFVSARMLEHRSLSDGAGEDEPVELAVDSLPPLFGYRMRIGTREIDLSTLAFVPSDTVVRVGETETRTLRLQHDGQPSITIAYTWNGDRYVTDARISVSNTGGQTPQLFITLPSTLAMNEVTNTDDERALAYVVNGPTGIERVRFKDVEAERTDGGPLRWAAVKNKYFVAAVLTHPETPTPFGGVIARPTSDPLVRDLAATLLPAADGTFGFRIFAGPQEPQRLAEMSDDFNDVNPFGFRIFRPVIRPVAHWIQWALYGMHDILNIGYGWVLILFGVLIRLLMWPLNAKAMRSQMKNMEIQPLMKEIQAKYKSDPQRMQQELLKLYKAKGFNPMGGCLPMLVPMPILITLYFVFQSTIAFRGVDFLWLPDLSQKDPFYILPIVLGLSMYLMQWLSSKSMTEQNPQMKMMMYMMPVMMTVIFFNFASGLNLYYAAMNFASIPQQYLIMKERQRHNASM